MGAGTAPGLSLAFFWMQRLKAVHATAAPYRVRPRLGNAGGCGRGCVREVPRARPLAAGVEGIERLGRWHRPYSGHRLFGGGGSQAGPVAPGNVQGVDVPGVRPRVVREGNCAQTQVSVLEGKWGRGGFLEKGQDSCGGLATPPRGRMCTLRASAEHTEVCSVWCVPT